jgi:hypothetical protein
MRRLSLGFIKSCLVVPFCHVSHFEVMSGQHFIRFCYLTIIQLYQYLHRNLMRLKKLDCSICCMPCVCCFSVQVIDLLMFCSSVKNQFEPFKINDGSLIFSFVQVSLDVQYGVAQEMICELFAFCM